MMTNLQRLLQCLFFLSSVMLCGAQERCILYGPFHMDIHEPHPYFTLVFRSVTDTATLRQVLEDAQRNGFTLVLNLTGSRANIQDEQQHFELEKYKNVLQEFRDFDFSRYKDIILCHLLFDEPQDPQNWGGEPIPFDLIDSAALYSKTLFPGIPTGVGAPATWLSQYGTYKALDYAKPQYSFRSGSIDDFILQNGTAAKAADLSLIYSVNVLSGYVNRTPFPPDELERVSILLLSDSLSNGLLYWKYDPAYFEDPAIHKAVANITAAFCTPSGIEQVEQRDFVVYSNPGMQEIFFRYSSERVLQRIVVWDAMGRQIFSSSGTTAMHIPLLPDGMYFLTVWFADGTEQRILRVVNDDR